MISLVGAFGIRKRDRKGVAELRSVLDFTGEKVYGLVQWMCREPVAPATALYKVLKIANVQTAKGKRGPLLLP